MKTAVDLKPSPPRLRRRQSLDATSVLTIYLVLLLGVPSDQGIGPLGGAGSPSTLFGLCMLLWWAWHYLRNIGSHGSRRRQPVRTALTVFVGCVLVSYVLAALTSLPYTDGNGSTLMLINTASYCGVILVANDGVRDRSRFLVLMRRLSLFVGLYALLGAIQFFSGVNFVDQYHLPGLTANGVEGIDSRGGFIRSESTARHPLEYAAVLAMVLPIALTLGIRDTQRALLRRFLPPAFIFLAAFISVTRSALLGIVVGLIVLVPTWERRIRTRLILVGLAGLSVLYVVVPGLAGTIVGMFSGSDPSVDSRTSSFGAALGYFSLTPVFGRGLGTMNPTYHIFDNQYFGLLIEVGLVGTLAFLAMILAAALVAWQGRKLGGPMLGGLGPALAGGILAGALLCAFFDAFHFPQAVGMLMLMLGLCGAYRNVEIDTTATDARRRSIVLASATVGAQRFGAMLLRRWYVMLLVLLMAIPACYLAMGAKGVYYAKFEIGFDAPPGSTMNNALRTEGFYVVDFTAMVQRMYEGRYPNPVVIPTSAPLYGTGMKHASAVFLPSAGGQWQTNFNKPSINVEIVGTSPEEVNSRASSVAQELERLAVVPQEQMGVWKSALITTDMRPSEVPMSYVPVRGKYAVVGICLLGVGVSGALAIGVERLFGNLSKRRHKLPGATAV